MELSAEERVRLAFRREELDRVPIFAEPRNIGFIEKTTGKKMKGTVEDLQRITAEAYVLAGVDFLRSLMVPKWGIEKGPDYDVMWDGYLNWKIGGETLFSYEEAVEFFKRKWCSDEKDDTVDKTRRYMQQVQGIQKLLGEKVHFMPVINASGLETMYHTIGIENFSLMMYENNDLIEEGLERIMEKALTAVDVVCENYTGPAIHSCDDWGMKGTTLFSPHWMRKFLFPRLKKVVMKIKAGGKYASCHSCGYVMDLIPDLIDTGVDHLDGIEITAGMDLKKIKELYGDKLVLSGNVDANILQMGTTGDVRRDVRRCIDDAARGGGYFLDGGITSITPVENVEAFFDEAKNYRISSK